MMDLPIYVYRRTHIQVVTSLLDDNVVRARDSEYYHDHDHIDYAITSTSSSSKILFSELLSLTLILKLIDWGVPSLGIQIITSSSMQL